YAPLFVNVNPGGMQWESDLIGYDAMRSYGSPSYHAQVMFSTYLGDEILDSKLENGGPKLFYSVTEDTNKSRIYVKLVNAEYRASRFLDARMQLKHKIRVGPWLDSSVHGP